LAVDKKLSKRRHLVVAYQAQAPIQGKPDVTEHTVIVALDVALKKVKRPKKEDGPR
jgi:regulator of sigma D